jgi:hypothetical protein
MKSARPGKKTKSSATVEGATIVAVGGFPVKFDSVVADVLAALLGHKRIGSLEGVYSASTTRLPARVHYLETRYGWTIERVDKATGCRDGRVAWVKDYFLAPEVIALAMAGGAGDWCANVKAARKAKRTQAAAARRQADLENAARKRRHHPGQGGLFDGGMS